MQNINNWRPTKFAYRNGRLVANADRTFLRLDSRLNAQLIADLYSDWIPKVVHGDLVDLGCGFVPMYGLYREHAKSITCLDWENSQHPNPHLDGFADLTRPLNLSDDSFDTVILSDVIEHLPEVQPLFEECSRILRPGGRMLLNTPFLYPVHEAPFDFHRFTGYRIRGLAESSGFEVEHLAAFGGLHRSLATLAAKATPDRFGGGLFQRLLLASSALADATPGLGARLRDRTASMPLGHFAVLRRPADESADPPPSGVAEGANT